ncbi:MAG: hypothetical protein QF570_19470 [Myxococcota bacterium]|jgi:hypothetical protein|nr:hypothetical protein [Myxococcota bacterium]
MLRRTVHLVAAVFALALFAAEASAQFTTLDPQQVSTSAGVDVSVVVVDRPETDLDSVLRAGLYAEIGFVDFSLYGRLPVFATLAGEPDEATVGNLEVGGAHRWSMDGPVSLVSHAGLVIPTASKTRKKREVAFSGSTGYVGDLYVDSMPELWGVRLATSPRLSLGAFFMQGDLGFDFLFPDVGSDEVGMRTSVGAGLDVAIATATLEIANAGLLSDDDSFEQTFSAGLDLNLGVISPRVTYTTGLSDDLGDDYTLTFGAAISF